MYFGRCSQAFSGPSDDFLKTCGVVCRMYLNLIIPFLNDCSKCYFFDQVNTLNLFDDTLYFARTESLHFDPVVPSNYAEDRNTNIDSDSDASIVIIDEVNVDDVEEIKDIKTDIHGASMEIDFFMDRSDTGNERNAE